MKIHINTHELFEFLKLSGVVIDEMKHNKDVFKYEKIFLALFFHDYWTKGTLEIDSSRIYNSYEEFMSKNREKKMMGMIEFLKKICEFEGIEQNTFQNKIKVDTNKLFEYLKLQEVVTDDVRVSRISHD